MTDKPHAPTTGQVETGFALYLYDYENIVISSGRDRFKAWLAERDARIEASAEQRGAIKALRDFKKFAIRVLPEDQIKRASILADLDESMNRLRETGHLLMGPLSADRLDGDDE